MNTLPVLPIMAACLLLPGFLAGIRLMQSPRTAKWGNALGALCMGLAVVFTMHQTGLYSNPLPWLCIGAGMLIGIFIGHRVKMIEMPQMVALLNGLGGLASAIVAGAATADTGQELNYLRYFWLAALIALSIGPMTFSGSIVAMLKLHGMLKDSELPLISGRFFPRILLATGFLLVAASIISPGLYHPLPALLIASVFLLYGLSTAWRVGGADMPILIALLNSFSGIAASVCGLAVEDPLLTGVGALVGVAGLILTAIMCRAMNRSLSAVLGGFTVSGAVIEHAPIKWEEPSENEETPSLQDILQRARKVIIVPGYGMAVAQAQHAVKDLFLALADKGKSVKIAVHPVAGRMPGHMNVLLAETGLDYEHIFNLDDINPEFPETDLVVVVGACDVVNPAANTAEGTPIYGMPVLRADQADKVIVCNLDARPGYSGVENTLYTKRNVTALWGDASETVPQLISILTGSDPTS